MFYAFSQSAMGDHYLGVKDADAAETCYDTALAVEESCHKRFPQLAKRHHLYWDAILGKARLRLVQGHPAKACTLLERLLEDVKTQDAAEPAPGDLMAEIYETLAEARAKTGDEEGSRRAQEQASRFRDESG